MRRILMLMVLVLILPFASAKLLAEDIQINRIRFGDYGYVRKPDMDSYVYVYNNNDGKSMYDARVSIRILDADIYDSSNSFTLKKKNGVGKSFVTPIDDLDSGEYLVRVVVSSNGIKRVKHRYIVVG